jgi:hypothetical protein
MDTSTLIDAQLREFDYAAASADNTAVRVKCLDKDQEVSDEAWEDFDGASFQIKTGTVSLTSGTSSVAVPTDFYKTGESGGVFIQVAADDIRKLTYLPPGELRQILRENGTSTGTPAYYSLFAMSGTTDLLQVIVTDIIADQTYTLSVDYMMTAPVLVDAAGVTSQLQLWPTQLHTMLLKGGLSRICRVMGDVTRQAQFEAEYQRRKASAISRWRPGQDDGERVGRGGYATFEMW